MSIDVQKLSGNKEMSICELFSGKSTAMSKVIIEEMSDCEDLELLTQN